MVGAIYYSDLGNAVYLGSSAGHRSAASRLLTGAFCVEVSAVTTVVVEHARNQAMEAHQYEN